MRRKLLEILRRVAHRLLLRRTLESCAVTAAAGGLCAAAVELGWWLSPVSGPAGVAVCALAALCGVWLWLRPGPRRVMRLDVSQAAVAAALLAAGGALGAAGAMLGWASAMPRWGASAALVCAGVLAGAVLAVVRGVSTLQAAVYLDIHGKLDERLATAAEAAASQADGTLADGLYAQALDALSGVPYRKVLAWKRTYATLGALALAAILCLLMGLLPALKTASAEEGITDLADLPGALKEMRGGKLRVVVVAMETLAGAEGIPEKVAEVLRKAARAVESRDDRRLREVLAGLDEATHRQLEEAIRAAVRTSSGVGPGARGGRLPVATNDNGGRGGSRDGAGLGGTDVGVYHPDYAAAMRKDSHPAAGNGTHVSVKHVWDRTRARAVNDLDTGQVPVEYRRIIRKFFGTERRP